MRVAVFHILTLALLCMVGTGCSLFKKNTNSDANGGGKAPAKFPGVQDPLLPIPPAPTFPTAPVKTTAVGGGTSILAGTVMDAYHRPVGNAYIRWVNLEDKDGGAPIDVAADAGGRFIIQGVKPGASYKLIARAKSGDKLFAGTMLTSAPNVLLVIPIREDVNATAPPIPGAPAYQAEQPKTSKLDPPGNWNAGQVKAPATGFGASPNLPTTINVPALPRDPTFAPGIADDRKDKDRLPTMKIPGKPIVPLDPLPTPPTFTPGGGGGAKLDTGPTRVPSCALVGQRLENLALRDTKGQVWEYRKQGQGKVVLIDFWNTSCIHCPAMMPALNRLQTQYGARGFEVIGIALESGRDERRDAEQVSKVSNRMQVSYRQLLGHVGAFDVGNNQHFNIKGFPTLMMFDQSGHMIYHHIGRPDAAELSTLERQIQSALNNRGF